MRIILSLALGLVLGTPTLSFAAIPHKHKSVNNLELWCGATGGQEKVKFPYLAAVKNYRTKHGGRVQIATVYKRGHVVSRSYVYKSHRGHQTVYESSGEAFTLNLNTANGKNGLADFKAVIRDEDGTKLIGNGSMPCFVQTHANSGRLQSRL